MKVKPSYGFNAGFSESGHLRIEQDRDLGQDNAVVLLTGPEAALLLQFIEQHGNDWWNPVEEELDEEE